MKEEIYRYVGRKILLPQILKNCKLINMNGKALELLKVYIFQKSILYPIYNISQSWNDGFVIIGTKITGYFLMNGHLDINNDTEFCISCKSDIFYKEILLKNVSVTKNSFGSGSTLSYCKFLASKIIMVRKKII